MDAALKGLFVGTALLNACHRRLEQLVDAESPMSPAHGPQPDPSPSPQTRFHPARHVQPRFHTPRNQSAVWSTCSCWNSTLQSRLDERKATTQAWKDVKNLSKSRYPFRSAPARLPQRVGGRESYLETGKGSSLLSGLLSSFSLSLLSSFS